MKNLLIYQSTEYDCGPTTLTNAIRYLFDREEIYPDIVKYIMLYCLDSYNEAGEVGKRGTSASAMIMILSYRSLLISKSSWIPVPNAVIIALISAFP